MNKLVSVVEKIIKSKVGIIPAFIYDENGIYGKVFNNLSKKLSISILENSSKILLQKHMRSFDTNKICAIYSKFNINIDAYVASNKLNYVIITPDLLLNFCDETQDKLRGSFELTNEQYKILIDNFDIVISDIENNENITNEILKSSLAKVFMGRIATTNDLMVAFIKGELSVASLKTLYLYDKISEMIKETFNINVLGIKNNKDLFEKVLITLFISENKDKFGAEFNDSIIKIHIEELNKIFKFIKTNANFFKKEVSKINNKFKYKITGVITYTVPILFENYIANNVGNYVDIKINNNLVWTKSMKNIESFINEICCLDKLLKKYISYTFPTNTINAVIKEYKEYLYEIDSVYREVSALYEELSYNFDFYIKVKKSKIMDKLTHMYFNVFGNINGKYISSYNDLFSDRSEVIMQDEVFKKLKFRKRTVFIFADGLRYEMAKKLLSGIKCNEVIDYNVMSLLPTETEVCMNGYFITNEKLRVNDRKVFELTKNDKVITRIIKWRTDKLSELLGCSVLSFENFKETTAYYGSVICFYNDVDKSMHSYDSSQKISSAVKELKTIISYSIDRNFDVMLLSDHGFIDIEKKIEVQDSELDSQKKKGRYLILSSSEKVDTMFYKNDFKVANFVDLKDKNICFINSINSLRQTSRYTHGGVSLQENIITALLFKTEKYIDLDTEKRYIGNVEAYNELKADISKAIGFECTVYAGTQKIFMTIIDEDNYKLRVSIRNYNKGYEFLIIVNNNDITDKATIKKSGNTIIDKELDIF
ncbi:PglZ domain-containing protein [Clostridium estertheticum]|uniref:PglZ domain-containing protein n=1 Tax=Clostridium estertheticum TaxID=238834 RepID=UPI001C6E4780|nr:PglZ domain-containing protein [Clostridium estertheticum]MBW9152350.1 PglZ domain-containing protein [Clostridium estertheticum]WLC82795.1 PglZ domain-containing protein [Clostridium estertheticum]